MKLVNTSTNEALVEFRGEQTIIHSKFLEQEMRTMGILIPHGMRGLFHGKDCVRLEDPEFQQAFREVYCLHHITPSSHKWQ